MERRSRTAGRLAARDGARLAPKPEKPNLSGVVKGLNAAAALLYEIADNAETCLALRSDPTRALREIADGIRSAAT